MYIKGTDKAKERIQCIQEERTKINKREKCTYSSDIELKHIVDYS